MFQTLCRIKEKSPLVHNITNYVVMNNTANALLAIGASPVMAHAIEEVEDIVSISSALVVNMGTLSEKWIEAMLVAIRKAHSTNTPFVFDPVGVGASSFRTQTAQKIIKESVPQVIRGNASEIMALYNQSNTTKGVDSTAATHDAVEVGMKLSQELQTTIVISGATDYIVTGNRVSENSSGSPLMVRVTGMGCTATSIIGACIAVETDMHKAASEAMAIMGQAGEMAEKIAKGPGSFQMSFIDSLYQLSAGIV